MEINLQAYAMLVKKGKLTLEQVPETLREQVALILASVPVEETK
jgi:hypothetical protein